MKEDSTLQYAQAVHERVVQDQRLKGSRPSSIVLDRDTRLEGVQRVSESER